MPSPAVSNLTIAATSKRPVPPRLEMPGPDPRSGRLRRYLRDSPGTPPPRESAVAPVIGCFEGTGIGPEVVGAALRVLEAVGEAIGTRFEIRRGGLIGEAAEEAEGRPLPAGAVDFCRSVFAAGGAVLSGPGGGRYVYDLRREFDLFCKFVPVRPAPALAECGCLRTSHVADTDLLILRDNVGGVYQGRWSLEGAPGNRVAGHAFEYREATIRRLVDVAVRAAADRRGILHVVAKDAGVPTISRLWNEVAEEAAAPFGVEVRPINVDLVVYQLVRHPDWFDVLVTPNLVGDIVADVAGLLVASRGVTFSGNYDPAGAAVYQTNHGCAHDLAGRDVANPGGQILSLAMLLRESLGLPAAAALMEEALAAAWQAGHLTADLAGPGVKPLGTREMTDRVVEQVQSLARSDAYCAA